MNLIELARSHVEPAVIDKASALVGEGPASTRRALDTAIPAVVAGLAGEGASTAGAQRVVGLLRDTGLLGPMASVTDRLSGGSGEDLVTLGRGLLGKLFGERLSAVSDAAASVSGVKPSSMTSLLGLAAPVVFGVLGSQVHARGLDATGVAALLAEQKTAALAALPAPLAMVLGGRSRPHDDVARREVVAPEVRSAESRSRLWPLLLLIPAAILAAFLFRRPARPPAPEAVPAPKLGVGLPPSTEPEVAREAPTEVAPPEGSIGHDLAQFLDDTGGASSKRFVFDHLDFALGEASLLPGSAATLDEVAVALKAHPEADVLVEGHTDATGAPADNQQLSLARADTVKGALVARGVDGNRIKTAGIGSERAAASNDTAEGRARNRRTELVVTRR